MRRLVAHAALVLMLGSCFDDTVTIVDNASGGAATVTITAVDATASESGDPGTFAVSRAGDVSQPLTVTLTVGGTATEGADFSALGTSVVIPAGSQIAFLTVTPIEDLAIEPNETVLVTVAAGTGYTVGTPASATVTIIDNDSSIPIVTVSAVDATASEAGDTGTFAVMRAGDSSQPLTVTLTVGGTATEGVDFSALGTSVVIPAGSQIAFLTVTPIEDLAIEANETVLVTVAGGAGYTVGAPASATVTIVDNDSTTPVVTVSALDGNASESGDTGSFAVIRAGDPSPSLTVNVTLTGTAVNGTDYITLPTTVSMPSGSFLVIVSVTPLADGLTESNETVILTVTAGTGYVVGAPSGATVTIADGPGLSYSLPETPAGVSGIDNEVLAADLGSDGEPRLIYRRGSNVGLGSPNQIRLVRRRPDGTWTTPVAVSANNEDFKNNVFGVVSRNNNFVHVFWLQTPSGVFDPLLHYAQFDAGDPPSATVGDTVISGGTVTNLSVGATFGDATAFAAVIDRSNNNVAAIWMQDVQDGTNASIPIVGLVAGGAGLFGEKFALVSPPTSSGVGSPVIRSGPGGALHVLYGAASHRLRTAVSTWSAPDAVGSGSVKDLVIAADGDAYAVSSGSPLQAAYRPAGPATTFSAPQGLPISSNGMAQPKVVAVLEPGTEHLHAFVCDLAAQAAAPAAAVHPAANLSGSWSSVALHPAVSGPSDSGGSDFLAFANQANEVTVVFRAPLEAGDQLAGVLSRSRPSGVASVYAPVVDLTAPGAFPALELAGAQNTTGNALLAWRQGSLPNAGNSLAPEIFARHRSAGVWSSPADNVSRSPVLPSHGRLVVLLTDSGVEHVFWSEQSVAGSPGPSDVYYARKP
jgi:hypothetical protein